MEITEIFAFLVHPNKSLQDESRLRGKSVPLSGDLYKMLDDVFQRSEVECSVEIALTPNDGEQRNEFRTLLMDFARYGTHQEAEPLAYRLGFHTTRRSGLGLLFLIRATTRDSTTVLLSRFPTERAIMAEEGDTGLSVEYLEQVFLKNASSYKAALFEGRDAKGQFWDGKVVDRQINTIIGDASRYWVFDFLDADFRTTSVHGTRRLARAILDASSQAPYTQKEELHHAAGLAKRFDGKAISVTTFAEQMGLSEETAELLQRQMDPQMAAETFVFNYDEFGRNISYRSVELHNGAIITATSADFQNVIDVETISRDDKGEFVKISTEGILLSDKLKRSK